ncbi:MAG: conjugal transfer protein TraX [Actinomycetia bacterium]|nr:conjugal transfer protein TraX [Actinomycetes bacterium]
MRRHKFQIDSFALKVIAIIGMTADHFGNVFWYQLPVLGRCLSFAPGGLTFPIMAFLLTVGYQHTHDARRYGLRLAGFALLALLPFWWAFDSRLNVLFTLLMGLVVIWAYDHLKNRVVFGLLLVSAIVTSHWCDWSYVGVPMILCYHVLKDPLKRVLIPVVMVWLLTSYYTLPLLLAPGATANTWLLCLPNLLYAFVGSTATIPLLLAYNGKRGRPLKYFFYAYYPAHIAFLALLHGLFFGVWLPNWLTWSTVLLALTQGVFSGAGT